MKGIQDGRGSEHGNAVDGDNEGTDVPTSNVSNPGCRGVGDNTRNKTALSDVALLNLKAKVGMFACDRRRQLIEAFEWIIGDGKGEGRKV
jgi:hypothetical protein